ncbi:FERM domain-containing protein 5-like isoform X1 [Ornithodoros turicata]|uniref:FERM domain-containing protein 5-like isoform X1 n=1 Tax=Ornithodoros turicata TaxID=34597 RepID=UPI003138C462
MFKIGSKKDLNVEYKCTIRLLDDSEVLQCDFQHLHKGQYILDYVCSSLNLLEKDYFGLRYVDSHKQRHWLDLNKPVIKQVKGMNPIVFCFRVKFYPPDPFRLKEEITRYQVFLQLRRDLLHGRLYCAQNDAAYLAALIIQSELGDYDSDEHSGNYVSEFKLLLKQPPKLEEKIAEIHQQQLRGQVPAVAEMNFLRKAALLETYGIDPHPVKDHKSNQLYLGINHAGILTFQGSRKTHHFKWPDIQKINYEGKMFIIHLMFSEDAKAKKKHLMGFKCPTPVACHHLWRCAIEQRYFFTIPSSSEVPSVTTGGGLFSRGSRFRYSGRVEKEVMDDLRNIRRDPPQFERSFTRPPSFRYKTPAQPRSPPTSPSVHATPPVFTSSQRPSLATQATLTPQANHTSPSATQPRPPMDCGDGFRSPEEHSSAAQLDLTDSGEDDVCTPPCTLELRPDSTPTHLTTTDNTLHETPKVDRSPSEPVPPEDMDSEAAEHSDEPQQAELRRRKSNAPLSPLRVGLMAWMCLLFILTCLLVAVMEWDWPILARVRKMPEMVLLRREYYEPAKDAASAWFSAFLPR